ncbi:MAG: Ig-like domain-containing protein [Gemmatimonadaceae bacterium]
MHANIPVMVRRWLVAVPAGAALLSCNNSVSSGADVSQILVNPWEMSLAVGATGTIQGRAQLSSGAFIDGRLIHWSAADPQTATVDSTGRVTAVSPGLGRISASSRGKSAIVYVSVVPAPVASVKVNPSPAAVFVGAKLSLTAVSVLATGDTAQGRATLWTTSNPSIATVASDGSVQGVAAGTATVSATVDGIRGNSTVTVRVVPVAFVSVTPSAQNVIVTKTFALSASTMAADSTVLKGRTVAWTSSVPTVATVAATGVVTALTPGVTTVTATSEGIKGTTRITVVPVPIASILVLPSRDSVLTGTTLRLSADALDSAGAVLGGRTIVWKTSRATVATVDATGLVTGVAPGTATITASAEGKAGTSSLTVVTPPVARVTVTPTTGDFFVSQVLQLTATMFDAQSRVLTGRAVTWMSGAPSIARVDANGKVTGLSPGTVYIFATSENQQGSALVTIR